MNDRPLQPLDHGNVLIVGVKSSNLGDEIRTHPRVIMWDSQHEHWTNKDIPQNVRAIFITRFIGHAAFGRIMTEARKKQITIFNPMGTGIIARQVRELLVSPVSQPSVESPVHPVIAVQPTIQKETETVAAKYTRGKLEPLIGIIDFDKSIVENANSLMLKAKAIGIETTHGSLAQFVGVQYRKKGIVSRRPSRKGIKQTVKEIKTVDVSVQILDEMIKGLQDMRAFLIETVNENIALKTRMANFKKLMEI